MHGPFGLDNPLFRACFVASVELHGEYDWKNIEETGHKRYSYRQAVHQSRQGALAIDSDINLFGCQLLDNRAKRDPEGAMIEYKGDDGTWYPYSAQVFRDMVIDLAKGLVGLGVNKGDSVAIVSRTRWEWTALDMAIMSIGALTVPVYETNSASQVSWIFNDSKVTLAIAEDDGQRDKIESVRDDLPNSAQRVRHRGRRSERHQTYGESVTDAEFWEYKEASHGDDRATIVYVWLYRHPEGRN